MTDDNVFAFPAKRPIHPQSPLQLVCNCGNTTHRHMEDGSVVCAMCDTVLDAAHSCWRPMFADPDPDVPLDDKAPLRSVVDINDGYAFLLRRAKDKSMGEPIAAIVLYADDASAKWQGVDNSDTLVARFAALTAEMV